MKQQRECDNKIVQYHFVPSRSNFPTMRQVTEFEDGVLVCNCEAFVFRRTVPCFHIKIVHHKIEKHYD